MTHWQLFRLVTCLYRPVWPDVGIKKYPISPRSAQIVAVLVKNHVFKKAQKVAEELGYFCKKICHQNFQISPNLVSLAWTYVGRNVLIFKPILHMLQVQLIEDIADEKCLRLRKDFSRYSIRGRGGGELFSDFSSSIKHCLSLHEWIIEGGKFWKDFKWKKYFDHFLLLLRFVWSSRSCCSEW